MTDLLPCPFCGGQTEYVCENDHHGDYFRLGCTDEDCPAHWTYYTEPQENAEECIRRWNTRALVMPTPPQAAPQRDPIVAAVASLAAAISLLERTPKAKKAAPSDKMFDQMLADYRKALANARDALALSRPMLCAHGVKIGDTCVGCMGAASLSSQQGNCK